MLEDIRLICASAKVWRRAASQLVAAFLFTPAIIVAQESFQEGSMSRDGSQPTVFLDCPACDVRYIRTEIRWVNYVRDRHDAQVYILVTQQPTGGGGTQYTIAFLGQREFKGVDNTLSCVTEPTETADNVRRELTRVLQLGLVRYAAGSVAGPALQVIYQDSGTTDAPRVANQQLSDPWNHWYIRSSVSGSVDGQQSTSSSSFSYGIYANRTTELLKTTINLSGNDNRSKYVLSDASTFTTHQRSYHITETTVHSLSAHWSAGHSLALWSSDYYNQRLALRMAPALEYDLFPYADATRRQLAVQYSLGMEYLRYEDTTIYGMISQRLGDQRLAFAFEETQPWGSASIALSGASYLNDIRKNNLKFTPSANVRIAKGLNLNFSGGVSLTHDQIYLSGAGLTAEEILVNQRQLATSYTYYMSVGLSYAFGSKFNNVVNPRFNSGSVLGS